MNHDLFWQWSVMPGALIPIKRAGFLTLTPSNGGDHFLVWRGDRLIASGSRDLCEKVFDNHRNDH